MNFTVNLHNGLGIIYPSDLNLYIKVELLPSRFLISKSPLPDFCEITRKPNGNSFNGNKLFKDCHILQGYVKSVVDSGKRQIAYFSESKDGIDTYLIEDDVIDQNLFEIDNSFTFNFSVNAKKSGSFVKQSFLTSPFSDEFKKYQSQISCVQEKFSKYITQDCLIGSTIDHQISKKDGFRKDIPWQVLAHPANLKLMSQSENSTKGSKSSITVTELLQRILDWDDTMVEPEDIDFFRTTSSIAKDIMEQL